MATDSPKQLGMIGLGRMGANIVRRIMRDGHSAVVYDTDPAAVADLVKGWRYRRQQHRGIRREAGPSAQRLDHGSRISKITDAVIKEVADALEEGDTIIDGGNSYYRDDIRHAKALAEKGIHFIDCGTSGGVWGLERGYCLMIGGEDAQVDNLNPIWTSIAPGPGDIERTPAAPALHTRRAGLAALRPQWCWPLREDGPQRHRVRDHECLRRRTEHPEERRCRREKRDQDAETAPLEHPEFYQYDMDLTKISEVWRRGSVVGSWLLDLTAIALFESPTLDEFSGRVSDSGEGRWTSIAAIEEGVPADVLTASLYARFQSQGNGSFANKIQSAQRKQFGGHDEKKD